MSEDKLTAKGLVKYIDELPEDKLKLELTNQDFIDFCKAFNINEKRPRLMYCTGECAKGLFKGVKWVEELEDDKTYLIEY